MDLAGRTLAAATGDPEFWRCYAFDREGGFDFVEAGEGLARRLNEVDVDDPDWDEEDDDDLSSARVVLPARRGWWLGLELNFELALHVLYLQKDDDEDEEDVDQEDDEDEDDDEEDDDDWDDDEDDYDVPDVSVELGHWDQARWHPFCLRWSELEAVVAQLRPAPAGQLHPDVALLLLARWVGHGSDETALLDERRRVVAGAFERLGLFHGAEAARMAAQLMQAVPEDDYAWRWDGERGWLLGGEYAGYSIRNDCHSRFPFPEFAEFRRQLGVTDGPGGRS